MWMQKECRNPLTGEVWKVLNMLVRFAPELYLVLSPSPADCEHNLLQSRLDMLHSLP